MNILFQGGEHKKASYLPHVRTRVLKSFWKNMSGLNRGLFKIFQTSMMELSCENSSILSVVKYLSKNGSIIDV